MRRTIGLVLAGVFAGGVGCAGSPKESAAVPDASIAGLDATVDGAGGGSTTDSSTSPGTADDAPDDAKASQTNDAGAAADGALPPLTTPIKHVVVIVKENHTFDNYFGSFPGAEGTQTAVYSDGGTFTPPHATDSVRDMCHLHECALQDWNDGGMNGWDLVDGSSLDGDNQAYAQYQETDIPNYWTYAKTFTLGDHFFADVLGPSFPGHMMFLAAQAHWATDDPPTSVAAPFWGCDEPDATTVPVLSGGTCTQASVFPCFNIPSVPDILPAGVDWKFYGSNFYVLPEIWSMFDGISEIRNGPSWSTNVVNVSQFDADVANNALPAVTWLVDQDLADEHPGVGGVCVGENWTVDRINGIMKNSALWESTAILFTMDDFGGWYDHVKPPRAYGCDAQHPYGLGFRLPLLIISPYAKPGFVFREPSEQASIPRFIERIFGATKTLSDLDPAAQDGQANDLMDAFDFTQSPLSPLVLTDRICPL
jgi:phospholipase C